MSTLTVLLIVTPLWVLAVVCPSQYVPARVAGALVAAGLAALLGIWLVIVSTTKLRKCWRGLGAAVFIATPVVALWAGGIWPIGLAALPPVLLSAHVIGRNFYRESEAAYLAGRKARKEAKEAAHNQTSAHSGSE